MLNKGLFTSERQTWATPQHIFEALDRLYKFTLDPCAEPDTAKCTKYYTAEQDGLAQDWTGERCFINPPYETKLQSAFLYKAYKEAKIAVCLIPARPDTKLWQDLIIPHADQVLFVRGRIKFDGGENSAPFPSAIVVFGNRNADGRQHWGAIGF